MTHHIARLPRHSVIMAASTFSIILIMLCAASAHAQSVYNNVPYNAGYGQAQPYCREQVQHIRIGNRIQEGYGTACLQPDGSWKLVSDVRYDAAPIQNTAYYTPATNEAAPTYCPPQYSGSSYYPRPYYPRPYYHASSPLIFASFSSGYHGRHHEDYHGDHHEGYGYNGDHDGHHGGYGYDRGGFHR